MNETVQKWRNQIGIEYLTADSRTEVDTIELHVAQKMSYKTVGAPHIPTPVSSLFIWGYSGLD